MAAIIVVIVTACLSCFSASGGLERNCAWWQQDGTAASLWMQTARCWRAGKRKSKRRAYSACDETPASFPLRWWCRRLCHP